MNDVQISRVEPGEAALEWLEATVRSLKGGDALASVTLVPPTVPAGRAALRRLAGGGGYANVRSTRLIDLASALAGAAAVEALTPVLESSAVRVAAGGAGALRPLAGHLSLTSALVGLFREL